MAVTKILAWNARLDQAIQYVLNGDKTNHKILTAHQNCDPDREYRQMMDTKRAVEKLDGCQCYHIIQSLKLGEVTPELALEIAKEFAAEYLPDYEVVITPYKPFKKHPKYTGFMALYVHYLYVLGKIE